MSETLAAISFDLDDTLWPIRPAIERAEAALQDWLARHYPDAAPRLDRDTLAAHRARITAEREDVAHDLSLQRRLALEAAFVEANLAREAAAPAFAHFWRGRNQVDLYPDVLAGLQRLAARFPLATLSNGNACVDSIGIGSYFRVRISARDTGCMKPAPAIFARTARELGVPPERILHVGDDPEADVAGARAAGFRSCWINREDRVWPDELPPADYEVRSLDELTETLRIS